MAANPEINLPETSELGATDSRSQAGISILPDMHRTSAEEPASHDSTTEPDNEPEKEYYYGKNSASSEFASQKDIQSSEVVWRYLTFDVELPHPTTIHPTQPDQEAPPGPPNLTKYTNPFDWSETRKRFTICVSCFITALTAFSAGAYMAARVQRKRPLDRLRHRADGSGPLL